MQQKDDLNHFVNYQDQNNDMKTKKMMTILDRRYSPKKTPKNHYPTRETLKELSATISKSLEDIRKI